MLPREKIAVVVARVEAIDRRLAEPIDRETLVKLSRERAELEPVFQAAGELEAAEDERRGLESLLADPEMAAPLPAATRDPSPIAFTSLRRS